MDTYMKSIKTYITNVFVSIDQLVNVVLFFGFPDESISSRCWRERYVHPWRHKVVDFLFRPFRKNHCKMAFEHEQMRLQSPPSER